MEKKVYTIIRTGCDADHGSFPEPMSEGSFIFREKAIKELDRLIAEERKVLNPRLNNEARGETWWEMNEDGYAAANYTRLEILESELNEDER